MISICEVEGGVQATYERKDGTTAQVRGKFLVGADGKRGYVRKGYLEAKGIEQRVGLCAVPPFRRLCLGQLC